MNWYLIGTLWFLVLGILGMTVFEWDEAANILLFVTANIWAAAGNVRDDLVRTLQEGSMK